MPKNHSVATRNEVICGFVQGKSQHTIATETGLPRSTVNSIIYHYRTTGNVHASKKPGRSRGKSVGDIVEAIEYQIFKKPSAYIREIRSELLRQNVCCRENLPSLTTVRRILKKDLNMSRKKLTQVPAEQLTEENIARVLDYIDTVSQIDPQTVHFFDEAGVKRTTANREYGRSEIGTHAVEVQRYASDVNYTLNLLHNARGVSYYNILDGPSNGFEMLQFFDEALDLLTDEGDHVISEGDTVIMDNCGFHHGRFAEQTLRGMFAERRVTLLFQPPYSPEFNTCEMCFRHVKRYLQDKDTLAVRFTELILIDAVNAITPLMSRNFFRYCGFPL
ncbi:uncharacterized protein [Ptychodera flava]|uniref:uncharacterized protein n=1 Tax=Ptychodera flava TaxID=63121 RepID=UPI00396A8167